MRRIYMVIVLLLIGIGETGCAVAQSGTSVAEAGSCQQMGRDISPYSLDALAYRYECQHRYR